jgi:putative GTP pyrophosphokinase
MFCPSIASMKLRMAISKTQIDRLGERLKKEAHTDDDLRLLDEYRRSFGEAYESVIRTLQQRGASPTGRLAKSTLSIAEKLRRESIRLTQIQDIAGCRVVVGNIIEQDEFVKSLIADFPNASVVDRRESPSHGYRAVHLIVEVEGKSVEIQVRTSLQHHWAELSEKSSDVIDPAIKYGGGPEPWPSTLLSCSQIAASIEESEASYPQYLASKGAADAEYARLRECFVHLAWPRSFEEREEIVSDFEKQVTAKVRREIEAKKTLQKYEKTREEFIKFLVLLRQAIDKKKGDDNDLSDPI